MSKVFWSAVALCAVVGTAAISACSSSDSSTPEPNGGTGGSTGGTGGSTGGTGGSTGGTGGGTGGEAGTAGSGGSGTGGAAGTGGTGGSTNDADCDLTSTQVECSACCASNHPVGAEFFKAAQHTCVCGTCATECATTVCATPPTSPDDACKPCAGACNGTAMTECETDTDCAAMLECGKDYCADKT